ncbi:hypothetical protein AB0G74_15025 [Streptomyces sp. NPDC020875]|uniref:hypothetical protein n=1 Tax=Streptomyces sp. NPDC020875 TaxID=3154898 RepID=UPI00340099E7
MPERLLAHDFRITPDYGGFDLYDGDCDARDPEVATRARSEVAAGTGYEIAIACAGTMDVDLTIEAWNAAPDSDLTSWEGHRLLALECPTGTLVISKRTIGATVLELPGPGNYAVRVMYQGWQQMNEAMSVFPISAERAQILTGERFVVQFWPSSQQYN